VAQKYKVHQNAPLNVLKIFSSEGRRKNVSPAPAVALDGPANMLLNGGRIVQAEGANGEITWSLTRKFPISLTLINC